MPKSLPITPTESRRHGQVDFQPIPINSYNKSVLDELSSGQFEKKDLKRIQQDMEIIRAFETMLNEIKLRGNYKGLEYSHKGPAHLSIGQEGSAVGQAYLLNVDDHIFGSHRSHGEILAKGLSAINQLSDEQLLTIMRSYFGGQTLKVVEKDAKGSVKDLAIDFLIYGALAEIFGRQAGFNLGFGGSMHAFFPPFGIMPNNAIVGGSSDISVGAALYKHVNQQPGIVICNIGDASASCGPTWEALCFATMDQFKTLWDKPYRSGLKLIINFVNNFYGMGGQPVGETMGIKVLARLGVALNPQQMHSERIDGYNPLAVIDAIRRKKQILDKGDGPVMLDTITYRYSGHSPSDASSYRDKSEIEAWQQCDSLLTFAQELIDAKVCKQSDIDAMRDRAESLVFKAFQKAADLQISPRAELKTTGNLLESAMFSNQSIPNMNPARKSEVLIPLSENPRVKQLAIRSRSAFDDKGNALPKSRCIGIRDALFEAIAHRFYEDSTMIAYGEENRDWGGAFAVYRGLTEALPYHRLFNAPIAEAAIIGSAVGYALEGGRALVELMYCDFIGRAGDELFNQLAKWQSMSGGLLKMPVVVRVSVGNKYGAQHSQDWTSMVAHIPGLKVAFAATPYDAKGLMNSALVGTDPVIFFESQRIYDEPERFVAGGVPTDYYEIPFGEPSIKQQGRDLTILTVGAALYRALDAARELQEKWNLSCEVIDARSIVPFNYAPVIESVKKTRKILLVSDACERGSALQTMANRISQLAFDELDAPPTVLGARNWITPADEVEDAFFPFPADIIDAVHTHILPLKGHTPSRPNDAAEILRRCAKGV